MNNDKKKKLTIVIPVFNEEEGLRELHEKLTEALSNKYIVEYIYIDDGSTDSSFNVLEELKEKAHEAVILIRLRKNCGKSAALSLGFSHAHNPYVVTLDADLQDDPEDIPKLINSLDSGYDLVAGWRVNRQDRQRKLMLSAIFNAIVSHVSGVHIHDHNIGLKAYKLQVIKEVKLYGELHRFLPILAAARGFKITEVKITHHPRKYGVSKFGTKRIFHASFDLLSTLFLLSFKNRPLQLFGRIGSFTSLLGIIVLTYLSVLHFLGESIGRRPLLLLGILLFLFGVQLILTGFLGELITSYHYSDMDYPVDEIYES